MLSQLMVLFGFFSLVLVMVYWVNRAVLLFDQLIADGQSAVVFLEFTALTLPNVIRVVLPISAFVATVYVTNRLSSESELVVMQSTGFSGFRLARPVVYFGLIVALLLSVLTHFLVPASNRELAERRDEISEDIAARFLSEGSFLHPTAGVTFYIREISPAGELRDIFLSDSRSASETTTYTAKRALLVYDSGTPKLLMFDGMSQALRDDGRLFTTSFNDFAYNIGGLIQDTGDRPRSPSQLSTAELLSMTPALLEETGTTRTAFLNEANNRFSQPLLAVVTALVGFSCLLLGGFSRFGIWRQIILAVVLLVILKSIDNKMSDLAWRDDSLWVLLYVPILLGVVLSAAILWLSAHPTLFKRWRRAAG
ncbi:LPS export ABC transporter permease LptF [Aliiroseovarius sp. YM-037]|uniref:LPS export ABC transporter permease LptF n=1 Tax=Aliiroseovarius sp. YM-037 TaxID=3341728 RepID=UPI003A80A71F